MTTHFSGLVQEHGRVKLVLGTQTSPLSHIDSYLQKSFAALNLNFVNTDNHIIENRKISLMIFFK